MNVSFVRWGYKLGIISLISVLSFFLMFVALVLSPIGIIFSIINFITNQKEGNKKERNFAVIGLILNCGALVYLIYILMHPGYIG